MIFIEAVVKQLLAGGMLMECWSGVGVVGMTEGALWTRRGHKFNSADLAKTLNNVFYQDMITWLPEPSLYDVYTFLNDWISCPALALELERMPLVFPPLNTGLLPIAETGDATFSSSL